MELPLLSKSALVSIESFLKKPAHAVAIVGAPGSGKGYVAEYLAASVLNIEQAKLTNYQYFLKITPKVTSISIENIRELSAFTKLKTAGEEEVRRVILIEDAHTMTLEAQNAVLKLLEEPPADTLFILTMKSLTSVLPTISSRLQVIPISQLSESEVCQYFTTQGFSKPDILKYYLMSGGAIGLMYALLTNNTNHPLVIAISDAKQLLAKDPFERLVEVDAIIKKKQTEELLFAITQIAQAGLRGNVSNGSKETAKRWHGVLRATFDARTKLQQNVQSKLLLTDLFLAL
jgi:DNA polymerase III delta prime subunit